MRVISLGWGVQSWTLAAMAALGELRVDAVLHADTYYEKTATYAFIRRWQPWLEKQGLRLVTVGDEAQVAKVTTAETDMPAFTLSVAELTSVQRDSWFDDDDDGLRDDDLNEVGVTAKEGQLRRQCTQRWKVEPMRRWLRAEFERAGVKRTAGCVVSLMGISLDEYERMKTSDVRWIVHEYPLIERRMTRADCEGWLVRHGLEVPPKSACVFCPFQGKASWQTLKRSDPHGWSQAVAVDEAIRNVRPPRELFVHRKRIPLVDAVEIAEDHGARQGDLFEDDPGCESGHCFV